jgi:hypothetical protein
MRAEDVELWLSRVKDKKRAEEARRFLENIFLLFDGSPPEHIRECIREVLELLTQADRVGVEAQKVALSTRWKEAWRRF